MIVATVVCNAARGIPAEAPFTRNDAETYKGEIVKSSFLRIFLVLAGFACLTVPAKAQAVDQLLVKIPFPFVAAGQTLPAGEYRISRLRDDKPRVLLLANRHDHSANVLLLIEALETAHGPAKVDFATMGDEHFLSRIETPDYAYSLSVPSAEPLLAAVPRKGDNASSASGSN
jgi:hypothetical protein